MQSAALCINEHTGFAIEVRRRCTVTQIVRSHQICSTAPAPMLSPRPTQLRPPSSIECSSKSACSVQHPRRVQCCCLAARHLRFCLTGGATREHTRLKPHTDVSVWRNFVTTPKALRPFSWQVDPHYRILVARATVVLSRGCSCATRFSCGRWPHSLGYRTLHPVNALPNQRPLLPAGLSVKRKVLRQPQPLLVLVLLRGRRAFAVFTEQPFDRQRG